MNWFKGMAALAMILSLGAGGAACSGGGDGGKTAAERDVNGETAPAGGERPSGPADMDIKGIKEKKTSAPGPAPRQGKKKKPYEKFDYTDAGERDAARKQVIDDLEDEKERTEEFLEDYDRQAIRKEKRAESIERWLVK